ncbi:MAG: DNA polymerase-3 subunit epsilon [Candidatus Azotimanducaceae bacterium]
MKRDVNLPHGCEQRSGSEMTIDFFAVDVETANSNRGSICAVGWAQVSDGIIVHSGATLTKPPEEVSWFDAWNTRIHGITEKDVRNAPSVVSVIRELAERVESNIVVAHNAGFDISNINRAFQYEDKFPPEWTFTCSLVLARRVLSLVSYKLPLVAAELGVSLNNHHEAGADAAAAAGVAIELAKRRGANSLPELAESVHVRLGKLSSAGYKGSIGKNTPDFHPEANPDANPDHPLFGQVVVFTGQLSNLVRKEAQAEAAKYGATLAKGGVTKKTTRLIIGDGFEGENPSDFTTGKAKKATELCAQGQEIEVLTEQEFLELLDIDA